MNKIRIMLVDDHNVLRTGLKLLINSQQDMEVVAEADNTTKVWAICHQFQPQLVVLDLSLPGGPSVPLIEKLSLLADPPRVLVLTMHDEPAYVRAAFGAGAKGYVVKTIGEEELLQAIRAVQNGRLVIDLDDGAKTDQVFRSLFPSGSSSSNIVRDKLSAREQEVMRLLGQGFSNQNIATQLDLSPKTVATYRARIGEKLGLRTTADFVKYAVDTGLSTSRLN